MVFHTWILAFTQGLQTCVQTISPLFFNLLINWTLTTDSHLHVYWGYFPCSGLCIAVGRKPPVTGFWPLMMWVPGPCQGAGYGFWGHLGLGLSCIYAAHRAWEPLGRQETWTSGVFSPRHCAATHSEVLPSHCPPEDVNLLLPPQSAYFSSVWRKSLSLSSAWPQRPSLAPVFSMNPFVWTRRRALVIKPPVSQLQKSAQ